MKTDCSQPLDTCIAKYPILAPCPPQLEAAFAQLRDCFSLGGKLLVCGNGGSAADADHIVGELMKGFRLARPLRPENKALFAALGERGAYIANHLQCGLPAISLCAHTALATAFANDVAADLVYAQQVLAYGVPGDVVWCISTSGNAANVCDAALTARALGLSSMALTGAQGGRLASLCDVAICVPESETYCVQELHLPIYHTLCAMVEQFFFV